MTRRHYAWLIGVIVPIGAASFAAKTVVDPCAKQAVGILRIVADSLPKRPAAIRGRRVPNPIDRYVFRHSLAFEPERGASRRATTSNRPVSGILVRRDAVRAAVRRGIRPSGSPVAASDDRPAGLVVYGWGAAGVGLADGDIITRVAGRTPTSVDDIVLAVAGAYKTKSPVVSGRIWRNGETFAVTVELPLPGRRPKAPAKSSKSATDQR